MKSHFVILGVAVPSVFAIQAGQTLHDLTSTTSSWSWWSVSFLILFAIIALLPIIFQKKPTDKIG